MIEQEQRNNGFTRIAGQCGYCQFVFDEDEFDYDWTEYGSDATTPGKNRGNFNKKFKTHLQNCRHKVDLEEEFELKSEFVDGVISLSSIKRRRSTLNNDNNNATNPVEVTSSRPKRQRRQPERFTNA